MTEPFSLKKLLSSPFTGMYWVKCSMMGLGVFMIVFTGYGLYKAYIKTPEPTTAQSAESIFNYYHQPKATFGCASIKVSKAKAEQYPVNGVKR